MDINIGNLYRRREAESRSITAENPTGERGKAAMAEPGEDSPARELGQGWKVRPCLRDVASGATKTLMDVEGPGVIRHMWFTLDPTFYRDVIIRIYWNNQEEPSVVAPLGDFMCNCWNARQDIAAQPVNVNPDGGMNIYFPMPFHDHVRITIENDGPRELPALFYTINYTLEPVDEDALCFHAFWRRSNPLEYADVHTIVDGIEGGGHYVGTFVAWQQNNAGWWGEGEIKMFTDDDTEFPTICGTGTEDYFGGAWSFGGRDFSAPYMGWLQVDGESGQPGCRMTMYRFHVQDPVFFSERLKVTMQALGWRSEGRYLPLQDDIASVAYWYQTLPHNPLPALPGRDEREII